MIVRRSARRQRCAHAGSRADPESVLPALIACAVSATQSSRCNVRSSLPRLARRRAFSGKSERMTARAGHAGIGHDEQMGGMSIGDCCARNSCIRTSAVQSKHAPVPGNGDAAGLASIGPNSGSWTHSQRMPEAMQKCSTERAGMSPPGDSRPAWLGGAPPDALYSRDVGNGFRPRPQCRFDTGAAGRGEEPELQCSARAVARRHPAAAVLASSISGKASRLWVRGAPPGKRSNARSACGVPRPSCVRLQAAC